MRFRVSLRVLIALLVFGFVSASPNRLRAESVQAAAPAAAGVDDTWQGTLHAGKDLRTVVKISKAPDGALKAQWYSIDQMPRPIPVKVTTFKDGELRMEIEEIDGVYTGKLSPDGNTFTGEWKQVGKVLPLILVRATKETAWAIPEMPKPIPPMAADADPTWEVATIKPAPPDAKGKGFGGPSPRAFGMHNTTLDDLIMFAYDVNAKQLLNAPGWLETDKYDITTGAPDVPGAPNQAQLKSMLRKLLADRFALKFHKDKREMQAYVLTVAKGGPKLTKNDGAGPGLGAFYFTNLNPVNLVFRGTTMDDFCHGMQGAVFDRPVVNRTGLEGHWDGNLKWTPDDTQFAVFNLKITPDESGSAPPPVFNAIQDQIGLKLDAEKTPVDVMVVDHAEKPSEN